MTPTLITALQIPEVQFCSSLWPLFKSKNTSLLWWSGVTVFSWNSVQCDIGFRRCHMMFKVVLEGARVGFAWLCFSLLCFLTAELLVLPLCPRLNFSMLALVSGTLSPGHVVSGWRADCLIWLLILCLFHRRRRWGGACPGDRLHMQRKQC